MLSDNVLESKMNGRQFLEYVNGVSYPAISSYFRTYKEYIESPIKVVLDCFLPRGRLARQDKLHEDDIIRDELYISRVVPENSIKKCFDDITGMYVFSDNRNLGSDILGDHYTMFVHYSNVEDFVENENGTYRHIDPKMCMNNLNRIIPHPGHKTIADLMKWGHCYKFENNVWVYDPDKRNHLIKYMKGRIRLLVSDEVGDEMERIADYAKLIHWMLDKQRQYLTEDQQNKLDQLTLSHDDSIIDKLLDRELRVQKIVKDILDEDISSHYEFEL